MQIVSSSLYPSYAETQKEHDLPAAPMTSLFQRALEQVQHTSSTESIPLDMQKKLLEHFEEQVKLQESSIKSAEQNAQAGNWGFVPPYMSERILTSYQEKVTLLKDSIHTLEIANTAPLSSRTVKRNFLSCCFPCFS